jgi:type IV secretory pathway TrbD component
VRLFPVFAYTVRNGGLLLLACFLGLTLCVLTFPSDKRKKLFLEPSYPKGDWRGMVLLVGRVAAILFVTSMFFTPVRTDWLLWYVGLVTYMMGCAIVMISLREYRSAATDHAVVR